LNQNHRSKLTTEILRNIFRFVVLILAQVLVIQNINLTVYIILLPYVMAILMLPFEMNKSLVLCIAFFTGVVIDIFCDSSGLHAAACSLLGFGRHYLLRFIAPREGYEAGMKPSLSVMGSRWFITYAAILILLHHFALFYLEVFRFSEFFRTLLRVILSSAGTLAMVLIMQVLFFTRAKNER
jgi:hypothetical protein